MGKRQRTSSLWSYFTYIDGNIAKCDICDLQLSHRSTTTNLKKHMERKHNFDPDHFKQKDSSITYILAHPDVKGEEICEEFVEMEGNNFVEQSDSETCKPAKGVTRVTRAPANLDHKYSSAPEEEVVMPDETMYSVPNESSCYELSPKVTKVMSIKPSTKELHDLANNFARKSKNYSAENRTEDEFDVAGRKLSYDLRSVSLQQRIIAEKLVSDIVYSAKLGKLSENSSINIGQSVNATSSVVPDDTESLETGSKCT